MKNQIQIFFFIAPHSLLKGLAFLSKIKEIYSNLLKYTILTNTILFSKLSLDEFTNTTVLYEKINFILSTKRFK